jgi:hypothetical protein
MCGFDGLTVKRRLIPKRMCRLKLLSAAGALVGAAEVGIGFNVRISGDFTACYGHGKGRETRPALAAG